MQDFMANTKYTEYNTVIAVSLKCGMHPACDVLAGRGVLLYIKRAVCHVTVLKPTTNCGGFAVV